MKDSDQSKIFSLLMTTSLDQEGKLQIQWGEQKIS